MFFLNVQKEGKDIEIVLGVYLWKIKMRDGRFAVEILRDTREITRERSRDHEGEIKIFL